MEQNNRNPVEETLKEDEKRAFEVCEALHEKAENAPKDQSMEELREKKKQISKRISNVTKELKFYQQIQDEVSEKIRIRKNTMQNLWSEFHANKREIEDRA